MKQVSWQNFSAAKHSTNNMIWSFLSRIVSASKHSQFFSFAHFFSSLRASLKAENRRRSSDLDWADLPNHVVDSILEKLESDIDYLQFGVACLPWHCVMKDNQFKRSKMLRHHQPPMLLIPTEEEHIWRLYKALDCKFLDLSLLHDQRFSGSSRGWLIMSNEDDTITLHKPCFAVERENCKAITNIHLPCLSPVQYEYEYDDEDDDDDDDDDEDEDEDDDEDDDEYERERLYEYESEHERLYEDEYRYAYEVEIEVEFEDEDEGENEDEDEEGDSNSEDSNVELEEDHDYGPGYFDLCGYHVRRGLITADPIADPNKCIVAVIFGASYHLGILRYGIDTSWTIVADSGYDDVLHYKNQFYGVKFSGELLSFDVANPSTVKTVAVAPDELNNLPKKRYLVESCGELLQVERYVKFARDDRGYINRRTTRFRIFKLDFDKGNQWIEIRSLGDVALFLGDNSSISVSTSDYKGCQSNSIYFTHDEIGVKSLQNTFVDLGIYDVESRSCEFHFALSPTAIPDTFQRPPIWFVPTFNIRS